GIVVSRTISWSAAVDSASGQDTRTMSQPASSMRLICSMVALASEVSVFVIVWTEIGASPPTGTDPTWIFRLGRRAISRQGLMLLLIFSVGSHTRRAGIWLTQGTELPDAAFMDRTITPSHSRNKASPHIRHPLREGGKIIRR